MHAEVLLSIALEVQREVLANGVRRLPTQHERHAAVICRVLLSDFCIRLQGLVKTSEQDMEVQLPNFVPQPVSGCAPCGDSLICCRTVLCLQPRKKLPAHLVACLLDSAACLQPPLTVHLILSQQKKFAAGLCWVTSSADCQVLFCAAAA